jgi:hypothetical protein
VLALKPAEGGTDFVLRVQEMTDKQLRPRRKWDDSTLNFDLIACRSKASVLPQESIAAREPTRWNIRFHRTKREAATLAEILNCGGLAYLLLTCAGLLLRLRTLRRQNFKTAGCANPHRNIGSAVQV